MGVKVSALPAGTAGDTDQIPANQAGTTRRITVADIRSGDKPLGEITGTANGLAGFDSLGVGQTINGWAVNTYNGLDVLNTVAPGNDATFKNFQSDYLSLNPSIADANQNWYMRFLEMSAGDDNSGFQVGDDTNGSMNGIGVSLRSTQTSNVGSMSPFNSFITLGNGTDPMSGRNITMFNANSTLSTGVVTVENMFGFNMSFNAQAGSVITSQAIAFNANGSLNDVDQYFGFVQGINFTGQLENLTCFQTNHSFTDLTGTLSCYTDFNQQASGTIAFNYYTASFNPNLNDVTGTVFGIAYNPTVDACGNADGLYINMSGVTSAGTIRAAYFNGDVQIDGDLSFTGALAIGQLNAFSTLAVVNGGGIPTTQNGIITAINANGTVATCDTIGISVPALVNLFSTFAGTSGGFGLGICALAMPNVIYMETGATLDNMNAAVFANTFDATNTGGTIGQLVGCRAVDIGQGGTQFITRSYKFYADFFAGDVADDSWGFYDNGAKYNWLKNCLKIGLTDTVTNASVGLELDERALLLARLDATEIGALTAVNGMLVYNTDTDKFQGRAAGAWVDLH